MARRKRVFVPGAAVHVFQRGNNRGPIFHDTEDRHVFLAYLSLAAQRGTPVHSYCLMTTHYHLLVTPDHDRALPGTIKRLGERYVQFYNRKHARTGSLWDGRYQGEIVADERYLFTCLRYIEQNPVKAGMVARAEDYRWSSYRVHAFGEPSPWLVPHPLYLALGPTPEARQAAYRALVENCPSECDGQADAYDSARLGPSSLVIGV
jgi:putative transposase